MVAFCELLLITNVVPLLLGNTNLVSNMYARKLGEYTENRYSLWSLRDLLFTLLDSNINLEFLKQQNASVYPNILKVLGNTSDSNYRKNDIDHFNKYFDFD